MNRLQILARLAFAATVFLIPFRYRVMLVSRPLEPIYRDYLDFILFAADTFMIMTLLLWLIQLAWKGRRVNFGPFFISIPLTGLTLSAIISSPFSLDPALSFYHSIRLLLLDAFYLYALNEIRSLNWVAFPLALQVLVQASVGIAQVVQQHSLALQSLGELELDPIWSGVSVIFANGVRLLRAYGLSDHPNILGGCLAFALLLLTIWFLQSSTRARVLIAAVFAFGAVALLLTFSRTAYLATCISIIFIGGIFWRTRQYEPLKYFALLIGIAALFVLPFIYQNSSFLEVRLDAKNTAQIALETRSVAERTALNETANQVFMNNPILGVGIGTMPQAVRLYHPNFEFYYQPAHLALLDAASETGIFGALFYFVLMITPWIALWMNRARLNWSPMLAGASAVLLAITVVGFFDYYTWLLVPGRLWQWTTWGIWGYFYQSSFVGGKGA